MTDDAVLIERTYDAPVDVVWQMWTDPEHFKAWYGPGGAAIPIATMDVRPGGSRLVCMQVTMPDGPMEMWFGGEYREVVENVRLVYTESKTDEQGNALSDPTEVSVELEDLGGRTKLVLTHRGIPADSPGAMGWTTALDKLTAHLASGARSA